VDASDVPAAATLFDVLDTQVRELFVERFEEVRLRMAVAP
jgi:hypothetical protein